MGVYQGIAIDKGSLFFRIEVVDDLEDHCGWVGFARRDGEDCCVGGGYAVAKNNQCEMFVGHAPHRNRGFRHPLNVCS
jgi:hypothetical protein